LGRPTRLMPSIAKHAPPLTAEQQAELQRLAFLQFQTFNESDVREEFLVPLIRLLGYERNSDYEVQREQSYALHPLFLKVGSTRIKLDYRFNVYKVGFWLLEAKKGECPDPNNPLAISSDAISQAHFYAHHREIDSPLFGASNGWWTNLYDRDAEDPMVPVLSIAHRELPARFHELYSIIGATQVTFRLKRQLLRRIEQVLSADVDLSRTDQFLFEVRAAAQRARPKVLENFRRNARLQEAARGDAFKDYLESVGAYEAIDTVLMWPLNAGAMRLAGSILARRLAQYPGSNQFLFFQRLLVVEPRAVTTAYYWNALQLLGSLCREPTLQNVDFDHANGARSTPIQSIFLRFVRMLLTHFAERPDLRVLWAMEALLTRMTKRALVSNRAARKEIAAGVDLQRYLMPEEVNAYLGPSPARTVVEAVERITLAELGLFFNRHYRAPERRDFDVRGARQEFNELRAKFEPLELATDGAYLQLAQALGEEWKDFAGMEILHREWDRLGQGVCDLLEGFPDLLKEFPDDLRQRLVHLAQLANPFARQRAESLGLVVPPDNYPDLRGKLRALFDPNA